MSTIDPAAAEPQTAAPSSRPRVAILFGGRSSEHSISLVTARGVLGAIDREHWDVVTVGIARTGEWFLFSQDELEALLDENPITELPVGEQMVSLPMGSGDTELLIRDISGEGPAQERREHIDVVLPLLHGPYGEDGTLQGMLELADMRYVGCGVTSSAVGMDKHFMKVAFDSAGLEVGPYIVAKDRRWRSEPEAVLDEIAQLAAPVFVKPARAGSSFGITRVDDPSDRSAVTAAVEEARSFDRKVVVEAGISGREIECAVLQSHGQDAPRVSLLGEIVVVDEHSFYDFEAKYVAQDSAQLSCPAEVPEATAERIRADAARAFEAVDGEGLSRADFFLTDDGRALINEVNTMPGFTSISMYPRLWEASGLPYDALLDELLRLALERPIGLR